MALYIIKELDRNGVPFRDDDTTEYFDDSDYNGNGYAAAEDRYNRLVAQTDAAFPGTGKDRWMVLKVG
ncbi:hypothetical protein [Streptomyces ipomoeae]|uniref:hypothetical protein n=1 Tax=Streptomyces ipomoeae TaxID=103232 RepID=UPI001146CF5D|nr:hypothetical protein [Streptomyces ipomoeae]TQE33045.1 hypothetical protein Sipo7851_21315 [Streptomyces ipomoeae]